MNIAIVGLGYVGLPLAIEFAKKEIKVFGIERKKERVNAVNEGKSYINDVDPHTLAQVVKSGNLVATQSFEVLSNDVDAIIICVPTPLTKNKTPDVSFIVSVSEKIVSFLHKEEIVILESTTYPGTTEEVMLPILEKSGLTPGEDFYIAFSPERVDPGNKRYHTGNIPKVVGGINEISTKKAKELYETIVPEVYEVSSPKTAEMTKLLENTFRLVNVALMDELALFAEKIGIDIWEVIDAAKTKPYGFMPFYPGPGIGGHCIPIDPFYLLWKAKEYDVDISFIELAGKINDSMPDYVINKVAYALNIHQKPINNSKILILGVAYKKDIGDLRESPALKIISKLMDWGADISYYDPYVSYVKTRNIELHSINELTPQEVKKYDCILILTDHTNVNYNLVQDSAKLIVDTRNVFKYRNSKIYTLGVSQ